MNLNKNEAIAQLLGVVEKLSLFESAILNFFLLHSYLNSSQIKGYQGWDEIWMITLISSKKIGVYKIMRNTVPLLFTQFCEFYRLSKRKVKSAQLCLPTHIFQLHWASCTLFFLDVLVRVVSLLFFTMFVNRLDDILFKIV